MLYVHRLKKIVLPWFMSPHNILLILKHCCGSGSDLYDTKEDDLYVSIEVFAKSLYDFYVGYKCFF